MQTQAMQRPNRNSKKCLTPTKYFQTLRSALGTTSLARLVLGVGVMLAILLAAVVLEVLETSLKHSLVAVHHLVAVVVNVNNLVRRAVKM